MRADMQACVLYAPSRRGEHGRGARGRLSRATGSDYLPACAHRVRAPKGSSMRREHPQRCHTPQSHTPSRAPCLLQCSTRRAVMLCCLAAFTMVSASRGRSDADPLPPASSSLTHCGPCPPFQTHSEALHCIQRSRCYESRRPHSNSRRCD